MNSWTITRRNNAERIWSVCRKYNFLRVPLVADYIVHAHYKCYVFIEPSKLPKEWSRDKIIEAINNKGIPCYQGTCSEVYLEKAFDGTSWRPSLPLKNAKLLGETSLMFLVHPTISSDEMDNIVNTIEFIFSLINSENSCQ